MKLLKLDHILITVAHFENTVSFYRDILGLRETWSSTEEKWVHLSLGNSYVSIFYSKNSNTDSDRNSFKHMSFQIESFENTRTELLFKGVEFFPYETPVSKALYIKDPEGNEIELVQYKTKHHS